MRAMLFAAGLGTRLRPLTDHMPKALVPVGGRPLLDITTSRLRAAGVTEMVINVHHFSNQIIDYVNTHDMGVTVIISDETDALLDTGGGLKKALKAFSQENCSHILIHNVDILSNADLRHFYDTNLDVDVALMVSPRKTQRYLLFDNSMRLVGWTNIATGEVRSPYANLNVEKCSKYAFSGIHVVSPTLSAHMESWPDAFPIMDFYLKNCDCLNIRGVVNESLRLLDVGKQDTLTTAEEFLQTI